MTWIGEQGHASHPAVCFAAPTDPGLSGAAAEVDERPLAERAGRDAGGRLRYEPAAGDVVVLRRAHACGAERMVVTLVGLDVRLSCSGCGTRVVLTRQRLRSRVREVVGTLGEADAP